MNKYELAVVVSAKIEDDARTAVIEKVKRTIENTVVRLPMSMSGVRRSLLTRSRR